MTTETALNYFWHKMSSTKEFQPPVPLPSRLCPSHTCRKRLDILQTKVSCLDINIWGGQICFFFLSAAARKPSCCFSLSVESTFSYNLNKPPPLFPSCCCEEDHSLPFFCPSLSWWVQGNDQTVEKFAGILTLVHPPFQDQHQSRQQAQIFHKIGQDAFHASASFPLLPLASGFPDQFFWC